VRKAAFVTVWLVLAGSLGLAGEFLRWAELPPLPPPGQRDQPGLAGAFVGIHNGALIVAGGANFPDAPPWKGGKKVWWDDVFVLERLPDGSRRWRTDERYKLPRPLAYGASISTSRGVLCIGGCDATRCYRDVFLLKWDPKGKKVSTEPLPPLPCPLAFMGAARVAETVFVVGGQETMKGGAATRRFFALEFSPGDPGAAPRWRELPAWPGPPRILPVVAAQNDGQADCLYVFSGRNVAPDKPTEILSDAFRYNPKTGRWQALSPIAPDGGKPRCVMAATAVASGAHHILVFGGADGRRFRTLEDLERAIAPNPSRAAELTRQKIGIFESHPGFSRDILAYHTITDTWTLAGRLPAGSQVTTTAVRWGREIVIPSGEIRPGVRTRKVWSARRAPPRGFGTLNYLVLGAYLLALVGMGFYLSRRERTTDDFFRAGRRIPWWASGLSIYGTQLSAITFMAIPAKTFATDWRYFIGNLAIVMVAPFIVRLFLPFYRRLDVTTAYEYLERRFNLPTRLLASAMFMLFQFGRIGIVLLLPSLALAMATGMSVTTCIVAMGVLCILYTALGGIEAVVWTDVLQVVVLLGGAILCLVLIPFGVAGGWNGMNDLAASAGKFRLFDFRFDLVAPTFWVLLLGGFGGNIISYGTDQTVIQRYLTTRDEAAAARGIWTNAIMCIPGSMLFFGLGSALFAFYKSQPQALNPTMANPDAILPWFVVTQLPAGLAGLLIAGVFAASMSSLDSSMNSVATAATTDFYRRLRPGVADRSCLRLARAVTVVVGVLGVAFALAMARWQIKSLWDQFASFLGLFAGGLGGLFVLAMFTRRAHGLGALCGLVGSGIVQYLIHALWPLHPWFYAVTGIVSCFVVGYLASVVIPWSRKVLDGLTIYTLAPRRD